ncbi:hypothetical protein HDV01_005855 [Terramyces sp. JEL0728]|nr:hypothetical protein HDV01_005855 [Terramyces sp. JEL0728]
MHIKKKEPKPKPIKKPMNCFFRYKQDMRKKVIEEYGVTQNNEISRIIAELWSKESPEIKLRYSKESEKAYLEHREKYPDFVWPSKLSTKLKREKKEKGRMEVRFNDFRTGFTPELEDCEPIQRYLASL